MPKKAARVRLPLRKKLLFSAAIILSALVGLEIVLRLFAPVRPSVTSLPHVETDPPVMDPIAYFAISDPYLGIRNRPDGSYCASHIEGTPLCTTDEHGYRNGFGWPGAEQSPIVLFVGDSMTFCAEVDDEQTGPSEVARLLAEESDVRVLNAGVRCYSTLQAKRMMLECFDRFPDVRVVVYTFCPNDIEENLVPNFRWPLKAPYLRFDPWTEKFAEVEVVKPVIPWGEAYLKEGDDTPCERAIDWLDTHSLLFNRCREGWRSIDSLRNDPFESPDAEHERAIEDDPKWHNWALRNRGVEALRQLILEMDVICRDHGAVLLVTPWSDGSDPALSQALTNLCTGIGVEAVNLDGEMTEVPVAYRARRIDGLYDAHYGPLGTRTYAKALAPAVKQILRSSDVGPAAAAEVADSE